MFLLVVEASYGESGFDIEYLWVVSGCCIGFIDWICTLVAFFSMTRYATIAFMSGDDWMALGVLVDPDCQKTVTL